MCDLSPLQWEVVPEDEGEEDEEEEDRALSSDFYRLTSFPTQARLNIPYAFVAQCLTAAEDSDRVTCEFKVSAMESTVTELMAARNRIWIEYFRQCEERPTRPPVNPWHDPVKSAVLWALYQKPPRWLIQESNPNKWNLCFLSEEEDEDEVSWIDPMLAAFHFPTWTVGMIVTLVSVKAVIKKTKTTYPEVKSDTRDTVSERVPVVHSIDLCLRCPNRHVTKDYENSFLGADGKRCYERTRYPMSVTCENRHVWHHCHVHTRRVFAGPSDDGDHCDCEERTTVYTAKQEKKEKKLLALLDTEVA